MRHSTRGGRPQSPSVRIWKGRSGLSLNRGFFPDGKGENFIRLPFSALTLREIEEGIRRLALAIEHYTKVNFRNRAIANYPEEDMGAKISLTFNKI